MLAVTGKEPHLCKPGRVDHCSKLLPRFGIIIQPDMLPNLVDPLSSHVCPLRLNHLNVTLEVVLAGLSSLTDNIHKQELPSRRADHSNCLNELRFLARGKKGGGQTLNRSGRKTQLPVA